MRIVLDTNVVLSALLWRGTPYHLLQSIRRSEHVLLFSSVALLTELAEVLVRPALATRLILIGREAHELLADYVDAVELVAPSSVPRVVAADVDDDQVIAAAVAAEADLVITGDRALLALGRHGKTRVVSPAEATNLLVGAGP